ncbi:MAG: hypothetical protein AB7C92_08255 [Synergistaceae bacterium]
MAVDLSDSDRKIWKSQFEDMIRRYKKFRLEHGREPNLIFVDRRKQAYVRLARFKEMLERWEDSIKENGRKPGYIHILPQTALRLVYWLRYADMQDFDPAIAAAKGCTDVFLSSKGLEYPNPTRNFILECNSQSIRVHAWIQCLYKEGTFISPNNKDNIARVKKEISHVVNLGFDGIHLDYIRYPGIAPPNGHRIIQKLVYELCKHTKGLEPKTRFSAAVMPEMDANARYYGQCYKCLAPYLDVQIVMAYKGNYNAHRNWITNVTKYVIRESWKPVWTGLQTYRSDEDPTPLKRKELEADIRAAYQGGAQKAALFRFGLSNI